MDTKLVNLNKGGDEFFGPDDELPDDVRTRCVDEAQLMVYRDGGFDSVVNLEKDPEHLQEGGQYYAMVSFMGPVESLRAKHPRLQINLRGCSDENNYEDIGKLIYDELGDYDIYTFEMYTWIYIPPNPDYMKDTNKHEAHLNKIISNHKLKMQISKNMFEARKRLMQGLDLESLTLHEDEDVDSIKKLIKDIIVYDQDQDQDNKKIEPPVGTKTKILNPREVTGSNFGGNYAIISIVGDDNIGRALKVKGFYDKEEDARTRMDIIKEFDNTYENYIVECYRWLPVDINPDDVGEKVYNNDEYGEQLNELHKTREDQAMKAKKLLSQVSPEVSAQAVLDKLEDQ